MLPASAAAGKSEQECQRSSLWAMFHFVAPSHAAQMLYAHAAIQEQKPFTLSVTPGAGAPAPLRLLLSLPPAATLQPAKLPLVSTKNQPSAEGCAGAVQARLEPAGGSWSSSSSSPPPTITWGSTSPSLASPPCCSWVGESVWLQHRVHWVQDACSHTVPSGALAQKEWRVR